MFNISFYPTPPEVIEKMLGGEDVEGKTILEPSAGAGHIVDYLLKSGANVIACENDLNLKKIVERKCKLIAEDFFTVRSEHVSHIDMIVMNPPFSNGADHINHAYDIAPAGCRIIALCNRETIRNPYSQSREKLASIVSMYGHYENFGEAFSTADRVTDVEVTLITIDKPGQCYDEEFEGFFMEDEEEPQGNGLMSYNAIRDLVNRYVECVKIFDQQMETAVRLEGMRAGYFDLHDKTGLAISITKDGVPVQRNEFKKAMQKAGWNWVFKKLNMDKYTTKGLKEDINKFVETQEKIPFTMRNIYKMLEIVVATTSQRMDRAILEVFDKVTKHYNENRYGVEGWKTNSHYLLTRKFIMPYMVETGFNGKPNLRYNYSNTDIVEDMVKALCYLTGQNYDRIPSLWDHMHDNPIEWGSWFRWAFFRIKAFKKGTMHIEFLDENVWAKFNHRVAKLKGYPLPEERKRTTYERRQEGYKEKAFA